MTLIRKPVPIPDRGRGHAFRGSCLKGPHRAPRWGAKPVNQSLRALERRQTSLNIAQPSEENLTWLRDVQARLAALEGTEALIDGFGALSGRPVRTF